jgi:Cu-Zn family superoxide dismutase
MIEGVAVFKENNGIQGYVLFSQKGRFSKISIELKGLKPNFSHGFHIHKSGDLRRGCDSCCSHYNPDETNHGGLEDEESHAGDLGNIHTDSKGVCIMEIKTDKFFVEEIIGRSVVIHQDTDDLGKGNNKESLKTGNSGKRIACAVIGFSEKSEC